jgi:hypothetical protein
MSKTKTKTTPAYTRGSYKKAKPRKETVCITVSGEHKALIVGKYRSLSNCLTVIGNTLLNGPKTPANDA